MRTLAYGWHLFKVLKLSAKEYEPDKFSGLNLLVWFRSLSGFFNMFLRPPDRDLVLGWRAFLIAKFVRFSRFSKTENRGTDKQCKQLNIIFRTARQAKLR